MRTDGTAIKQIRRLFHICVRTGLVHSVCSGRTLPSNTLKTFWYFWQCSPISDEAFENRRTPDIGKAGGSVLWLSLVFEITGTY